MGVAPRLRAPTYNSLARRSMPVIKFSENVIYDKTGFCIRFEKSIIVGDVRWKIRRVLSPLWVLRTMGENAEQFDSFYFAKKNFWMALVCAVREGQLSKCLLLADTYYYYYVY